MTLALIAGSGALPALIAARQPVAPIVASLQGHAPDGLSPDVSFRLEQLGGALAELKARGVTRICMVGKVARPQIDVAELDDETRALLPRMVGALAEGDDAALRVFVSIIEDAGFEVVGAHEIAGDLLPRQGVLVGQITSNHRRDAARGEEIVAALGRADLGQACVVLDGQALALEAHLGTDWMLRSLLATPSAPSATVVAPSTLSDPIGLAADWLTGPASSVETRGKGLGRDPMLPPGGLLFKAPKPGQERRVDLPTIGPETLRMAAKVGLEGVVVEAGGVLVLELETCRDIARQHGIFLWVRAQGEGDGASQSPSLGENRVELREEVRRKGRRAGV